VRLQTFLTKHPLPLSTGGKVVMLAVGSVTVLQLLLSLSNPVWMMWVIPVSLRQSGTLLGQ